MDDNPAIAAQFGIMSIPTVMRFENGAEVSRVVGAVPKAEIVRRLGL